MRWKINFGQGPEGLAMEGLAMEGLAIDFDSVLAGDTTR